MLKWFKMLAGAVALVALAAPVVAQQSPASRSVSQAVPKKAELRPKYLVVFSKVLMRNDKNGTTAFGYQNGRLFSERQQNGVVGTYQYDSGKFTGVVYTDGRYITVTYNPSGSISGLRSNTGARVKFSGNAMPTRLGAFATIQNGIAALRNPTTSNECVGTDDNATCTIIVLDSMPDDGGWGGGGAIFDAGEGGILGGPKYPNGTNYETPQECKDNVCEGGKRGMEQICVLFAKPGLDRRNCYSKSTEWYSKCPVNGCERGDWSWLEEFNFVWG